MVGDSEPLSTGRHATGGPSLGSDRSAERSGASQGVGRNNRERRRLKERARKQGGSRPPAAGASFQAAAAGEVRRHEVDALVARHQVTACQALDAGDRAGFERAAAELAGATADTTGRRLATRALLRDLQLAVTDVWRNGWQPADVIRVANRRLSDAPGRLLRDAVADELRRYPPDTVDPRWRAQCEAADVRVWWPADRNPLQARAEHGESWPRQVSAAVEAFHLLRVLPPLAVLTPPPGSADARRSAATAALDEVDERVLARVRALLAKAESTQFPAEAETFTAGAQALMARHSIDAAMVADARSGPDEEPVARRLGLEPPYEEAKALLFQAVAEANRCRAVWSKELGFVTVMGFAADLHAVETLATSLLVQASQVVGQAGSRTTASGRSRTRSFRQSFLTSFAIRIGERLAEATRAEGDRAAGQAGYERLLPVLAQRDARVDAVMGEFFPGLTHRPVSLGYDGEGWASGRAAADLAALRTGAPLTPSTG